MVEDIFSLISFNYFVDDIIGEVIIAKTKQRCGSMFETYDCVYLRFNDPCRKRMWEVEISLKNLIFRSFLWDEEK